MASLEVESSGREDSAGLPPVAQIEPVGGHGGMNYYDFGLCEGLVVNGVQVTLYTCDKTEVPPGLPFTVCRPFRRIFGEAPRWIRGLRYLAGGAKALTDARRRGSRIAHFHSFHVGAVEYFLYVFARVLGMHVVITVHDVEPLADGLSVPALTKKAYRGADAVMVHNEVSRRELEDRLGIRTERIAVVPHGDYVKWAAGDADREAGRRRLQLGDRGPILLFFGQIKGVKGLDLLLRALPEVVERFPEALLLVAGKVWKDDFSRYRALIRSLGLEPHCRTRIEYIPDSEASDYFAAADLVVLPYRRIYQSGVLLMSMSHGRAVLAADLPGMTEIIRDDDTGYLFESGDVESLSDRIIEVLSDPERREVVARRGYSYVRSRHDWTNIGAAIARVYSKVATD